MNEPQPDRILQVGLGFWASKALLSAVEMELFTELAKHPEDLETLQARLNLHPRSARDFLDALIAEISRTTQWSLLQRAQHGFFSRQAQAILYRWHSRDGQQPAVSVLEPSHHGTPNGTSAKRDERRQPQSFRSSLRRTGTAQAVPESHDRCEP